MTKPSGRGRHSFIQFYPDDWKGGTARMSRISRDVYLDLCCYTWDKAAPVPAGTVKLIVSDLPNGAEVVDNLVESGALVRSPSGSVHSPRALAEAKRAFSAWKGKSRGGKTTPKKKDLPKIDGTLIQASPIELELEPDLERKNSVGKKEPTDGKPSDPLKELFDVGVMILTKAGHTERQARSLIGKWRKGKNNDGEVLLALLECRTKLISDPVEWLTKRLDGTKYVSATGYVYHGTLDSVIRESERRGDWDTHWKAKGDRGGRKTATVDTAAK